LSRRLRYAIRVAGPPEHKPGSRNPQHDYRCGGVGQALALHGRRSRRSICLLKRAELLEARRAFREVIVGGIADRQLAA
jgi:hypothetical protein